MLAVIGCKVWRIGCLKLESGAWGDQVRCGELSSLGGWAYMDPSPTIYDRRDWLFCRLTDTVSYKATRTTWRHKSQSWTSYTSARMSPWWLWVAKMPMQVCRAWHFRANCNSKNRSMVTASSQSPLSSTLNSSSQDGTSVLGPCKKVCFHAERSTFRTDKLAFPASSSTPRMHITKNASSAPQWGGLRTPALTW